MKEIIRRLFRRREMDGDIREEIEAHIAMRAELNRQAGMSEADAKAEARRQFGNVTSVREEIYHFNGFGFLETVFQDLRYALRTLWRNPAFTAVAVLSLAIGIGANTAVFSLIDPLFFEKLPLPYPEELVTITPVRPDLRILMPTLPEALSGKFSNSGLTYREFERLRDGNDVLAGIFVSGGRKSGTRLMNADGEFDAQGAGLDVEKVSSGFFQTLDAAPALGRTFIEDDDHAGAAPVGIISYALWRQRFGLDPNVIGKQLALIAPARHPDDEDVRTTITVVGVAPRGFTGFEIGHPTDIWTPLQGEVGGTTPTDFDWWRGHVTVARLRPGGRAQRAQTSQSVTTWDTGLLGDGVTMVGPIHVDGYIARPGEDLWSFATAVGPRFFETVGVSLVAGRDFRREDLGRRVAVINETMARFFFGDQNPIGRFYRASLDPKWNTEIIGVAEDTKYSALTGLPPRITYTPLSMNGQRARAAKFAVRTTSSSGIVSDAITVAVKELDPKLQITSIRTLEESVQAKLVQQRFLAHLASLFSVFALFLASVGVYGTLSNAVTHRTNEIGIRLALGAQGFDVIRMLMRETGWILGAGLLVGLMGAVITTRAISSLLFGLTPTDPSTFAAAVVLLISVAAVAAYMPARRASRVDPIVALRHD